MDYRFQTSERLGRYEMKKILLLLALAVAICTAAANADWQNEQNNCGQSWQSDHDQGCQCDNDHSWQADNDQGCGCQKSMMGKANMMPAQKPAQTSAAGKTEISVCALCMQTLEPNGSERSVANGDDEQSRQIR